MSNLALIAKTQSLIALECAFDLLAERVGLDQLAFRQANVLRNGLPTVTGQVFHTGVGIAECLEAALGEALGDCDLLILHAPSGTGSRTWWTRPGRCCRTPGSWDPPAVASWGPRE